MHVNGLAGRNGLQVYGLLPLGCCHCEQRLPMPAQNHVRLSPHDGRARTCPLFADCMA